MTGFIFNNIFNNIPTLKMSFKKNQVSCPLLFLGRNILFVCLGRKKI